MQALFFSPFLVIKQHGQATFTPFYIKYIEGVNVHVAYIYFIYHGRINLYVVLPLPCAKTGGAGGRSADGFTNHDVDYYTCDAGVVG